MTMRKKTINDTGGLDDLLRALYPDRWALLLVLLCGPTRHKHWDPDVREKRGCETPGKRPLRKRFNRDALDRFALGTAPRPLPGTDFVDLRFALCVDLGVGRLELGFDPGGFPILTVMLTLRAASLGTSSVKYAPGVRVAIVANGPRYSAGALGLGSNRSSWDGPPHSHTNSTARAQGLSAANPLYANGNPYSRPLAVASGLLRPCNAPGNWMKS